MGAVVSEEGGVAAGSFPGPSQPKNRAQTVRRRATDRAHFLFVCFQKFISFASFLQIDVLYQNSPLSSRGNRKFGTKRRKLSVNIILQMKKDGSLARSIP
jgi:hypothetical protein